MSGWEAAPLIREAAPTCRIVFLSQHDASVGVQEAVRVGGSGYVCKSDAGRELISGIEAVLREEFFASSSCNGIARNRADGRGQEPIRPQNKTPHRS